MQAKVKIAVAGATGRVGQHVVEVLRERGYEPVAMSRSLGIDIITGEGLAAALEGVSCIIDAASDPSPDQEVATHFFTTAARNLYTAGAQAGVQRIVVVSIIGTEKFSIGYGVAKLAHEQEALAGPIPTRILRAAQFHEFVPVLIDWGMQGEVCYLPKFRTQLVAARAAAEALVDLATSPDSFFAGETILEVAGPREENFAEMARAYLARRGDTLRVEEVSNPDDPTSQLYANGSLLPGPNARLAGPTFEQWLDATFGRATGA